MNSNKEEKKEKITEKQKKAEEIEKNRASEQSQEAEKNEKTKQDNNLGGEKVDATAEVKTLDKRRDQRETEADISNWVPKTKLGKLVKEKKIKDIDEILEKELVILESEISDSLLALESDILFIGQAKGKFGGGKRRIWRQTQKKTAEGNVPTFSCLAVVGDKNSHIGIGSGRAKETLPARSKALRRAKLNITKIKRGCGSFDCSCSERHSVPFRVKGKCGSSRIVLIPAPQGTGLAIGDECKKILRLAGISDVYSKTFGRTRTTINLAKACMDALKKTNMIK